jgi:hypothetical protein
LFSEISALRTINKLSKLAGLYFGMPFRDSGSAASEACIFLHLQIRN